MAINDHIGKIDDSINLVNKFVDDAFKDEMKKQFSSIDSFITEVASYLTDA